MYKKVEELLYIGSANRILLENYIVAIKNHINIEEGPFHLCRISQNIRGIKKLHALAYYSP